MSWVPEVLPSGQVIKHISLLNRFSPSTRTCLPAFRSFLLIHMMFIALPSQPTNGQFLKLLAANMVVGCLIRLKNMMSKYDGWLAKINWVWYVHWPYTLLRIPNNLPLQYTPIRNMAWAPFFPKILPTTTKRLVRVNNTAKPTRRIVASMCFILCE